MVMYRDQDAGRSHTVMTENISLKGGRTQIFVNNCKESKFD
jgi:hypothetical protein